MDQKDYLKEATKKIYKAREKEFVTLELADHIETEKELQLEIGYEQDIAEEKAVEHMGDPDDIAESLGRLHTTNKSPMPYIATAVIRCILYITMFKIALQYCANDVGGDLILLALSIAFVGVYMLTSALKFKLLSKDRIIGGLIEAVPVAMVALFTNSDLQRYGGGNLKSVLQLVFKGTVSENPIGKNTISFVIPSVVLFVTGVVIAVVQAYLLVRYNKAKTTKNDNSLKHNSFKVLCSLAIVFMLVSAFVGFRFYAFTNVIKETYLDDYRIALDIAKNCEHIDDVTEYVKENNLEFVPTEKDGKITGYSYDHGIATILIYTEEPQEPVKMSPLEKVFSNLFVDAMVKDGDVDELLAPKNEYVINVAFANMSKFRSIESSLSLINLRTSGSALEQLYSADADGNMTNEDKWKFYGNFVPSNAVIMPAKDFYKYNTYLELYYQSGFDDEFYSTDFDVTIFSGKHVESLDTIAEIEKTVEDNPSITAKELAKKFNAKIIPPDESFEEYKKGIRETEDYLYKHYDELGVETNFRSTDEALKQQYQQKYEYKLNDYLYYNFVKKTVDDTEYTLMCFFSKKDLEMYELYNYPEIEDNKDLYEAESVEAGFYKVKTPKGYCSSKGQSYENYLDVPYYNKKGEKYIVAAGGEGGVAHWIIGTKGDRHDFRTAYIDENSYLVFFEESELRQILNTNGETVHKFKDKKGNAYTKACQTSWNEKGELIDYNEYD